MLHAQARHAKEEMDQKKDKDYQTMVLYMRSDKEPKNWDKLHVSRLLATALLWEHHANVTVTTRKTIAWNISIETVGKEKVKWKTCGETINTISAKNFDYDEMRASCTWKGPRHRFSDKSEEMTFTIWRLLKESTSKIVKCVVIAAKRVGGK